jgi:hypothetical protein
MIRINKLINNYLDTLTYELNVISYTFSNTNKTITINLEDKGYIRAGWYVIVNGNKKYYVNKVIDNTIEIDSQISIIINSLKIEKPNYLYGTVNATKNELSIIEYSVKKFPLIYLLEVISEKINNEYDSMIERTADLRIYFLDEADFENWLTETHYTQVIDRMRWMAEYFIENLEYNPNFSKTLEYELLSHAKFGTYQETSGHIKNIFNENLSGIELRINLPITKILNC